MAIKNILVALAPGGKSDPGRDYAISMARAFSAHVTARSYALEPEITVDVFGGVPAEILQEHRAAVTKEAEAAVKAFETAARKAKVQYAHSITRAALATAAGHFGTHGRVHDVSVVTQSAPGLEHVGDVFAEAALFQSGRPAIIVPKRKQPEYNLDRALIAWDGGAHAARAVALSMPLLMTAKKVEVLVVGKKAMVQQTQARELVRNLERHGLKVELNSRDDEDPANAITKEAKVWSASMLVMGAYGHSRLGEWIFGGVTRYMLSKAPLPVLMAH